MQPKSIILFFYGYILFFRRHYPIAQCVNFKFSNFNPDANLSKDGVIIAHISIALNRDKNVNDEILLTKSIIIYPKENFWNLKN